METKCHAESDAEEDVSVEIIIEEVDLESKSNNEDEHSNLLRFTPTFDISCSDRSSPLYVGDDEPDHFDGHSVDLDTYNGEETPLVEDTPVESREADRSTPYLGIDEVEYQKIRDDAENRIISIPAIESHEELRLKCMQIGVKPDFTIMKRMFLRDRPKTDLETIHDDPPVKKSKKSSCVYQTNYEVESILDFDEEGERFLIKWKGYDEEDSTWEPREHLSECQEILMEFEDRKEKAKEERKRAICDSQILWHLKNQITAKEYNDPTVILKMLNIPLGKFKISLLALKKEIGERFRLLEMANTGIFGPVRAVDAVVSKLNLRAHFGSVQNFKEFFDRRKRVQEDLKQWENEINRVIRDEGIHAEVTIENFVDLEGPPENFTYITKCKPFTDDIVIESPPVIWCDCVNCFDNRKNCTCPTIISNNAKFAYNRDGVIRDGISHIVECNEKCKCPPDCPNRAIQNGTQVPLTIFRTDDGRGWGVKAKERILKGKFVMEYVGEIIPISEANTRGKDYDAAGRTYLFDLDLEDIHEDDANDCAYTVDATKYGNVSHFVNHSCDPNMEVYGAWINNLDRQLPKLVFFSRRQISRGEELTFDYRMCRPQYTREDKADFNGMASEEVRPEESEDEYNSRRIVCKCNEPDCRRFLF